MHCIHNTDNYIECTALMYVHIVAWCWPTNWWICCPSVCVSHVWYHCPVDQLPLIRHRFPPKRARMASLKNSILFGDRGGRAPALIGNNIAFSSNLFFTKLLQRNFWRLESWKELFLSRLNDRTITLTYG